MELYVLNKNFETVAIIDSFTSMIWTDRFNKAGDFELYMPTSSENLAKLVPDYYLWNKDSEHLMIIEDIKTNSDIEQGNNLTVTGRSLESILDRRIIWNQTEINDTLQNGIKTLINQNIISPSTTARRITNFIFEDSTESTFTGNSALTLEAQYNGENLYDVITKICEDKKIGFKITLNSSNQFVFKLYTGINRSYTQNANAYVIFSPNYENIVNSEYQETKSSYKNVVLVVTSGEDDTEIRATAGSGSYLNRRELYLKADNIKEEEGNITNQLKEKGNEELKNYKILKEFYGEVETTKMFIYGRDYYMGDIVELEDEYGRQSTTKVVEFVMNQDRNGYKAYPTFEVMDE